MSCEKRMKIEDHSDSESEPHEFETCEDYLCVECNEAFLAKWNSGKVSIVDTSRRDSFIFITSFSEIMGNKKQLVDGEDDSDSSSCVTFEKVHLESAETGSDAQSRD